MSVMWNKSGGKAIIKPIKIPYPSYTGIFVYTGSVIQPAWTNYDENKITLSGTYKATNVGTYTAKFTPKLGFCWENGSTTAYSINWTIYKEKLAVPSQSGTLKYNTSQQTPTWKNYDSTKLTLGGVTKARIAGTYEATFSLKSGYIWSDGTTATIKVSWTIKKATPTLTVEPTELTLSSSKDADGKEVIATMTNPASNQFGFTYRGDYLNIVESIIEVGKKAVIMTPLKVGTVPLCRLITGDKSNVTETFIDVPVTITE